MMTDLLHALWAALAPHRALLAAALLGSFAVALLTVLTRDWHPFSMDVPGAVQTAHHHPTPRIGGVGIFLGLALAWALLPSGETRGMLGIVLVAGLPAWLFGLAEDVTKRVGVLPRLLATMCSGALACYLSATALTRVDLPWVDAALAWWPLAVLFTTFAVGGVANAVNIIDGFHGLASGTSMVALLAVGALAAGAGDLPLAVVCGLAAAAVGGFWLVNYPWGKLFLGDGGAYFTGFALAWVALLLPMRNQSISPWASLLICAYPFIEVMYSMARRRLQRLQVGQPDNQHLHSLLFSQLVRKRFPNWGRTAQNAAVAPMVWLAALLLAGLAAAFQTSTPALAALIALAALAYHGVYRWLCRVPVGPASATQHPLQPEPSAISSTVRNT
jgi:UDP-N-acetylmuramyl pentapeptide phosphotransferase/UDP-N-acetylglucosamine-1-phosphate transferase